MLYKTAFSDMPDHMYSSGATTSVFQALEVGYSRTNIGLVGRAPSFHGIEDVKTRESLCVMAFALESQLVAEKPCIGIICCPCTFPR